jgi:hypothetical protein
MKETFDSNQVKIANKTARAAGAVGARAIVPRYVETIANEGAEILDYGSGPMAAHTMRLRALGLNVTAHEFGDNVRPGIHDSEAMNRIYHIVFASNVLNVQSSPEMLKATLREIAACVRSFGGRAVFNYPESPRKSSLTAKEVEAIIAERFPIVKRVGGTKQAPMFEAGFI